MYWWQRAHYIAQADVRHQANHCPCCKIIWYEHLFTFCSKPGQKICLWQAYLPYGGTLWLTMVP